MSRINQQGKVDAEAGAALVETALTLPLIALVLLGSLMLGYLLWVRIALNLVVHKTALDLARMSGGAAVADSLRQMATTPDRTFGLDSNNLTMVAVPLPFLDPPRVVVAACYKVPFALPDFDLLGGSGHAGRTERGEGLFADLEDQLETAHEHVLALREKIAAARATVRDMDQAKQLLLGLGSADKQIRQRSLQVLGQMAVEKGMAGVCRENGVTVQIAQVVMTSAPSKHACLECHPRP